MNYKAKLDRIFSEYIRLGIPTAMVTDAVFRAEK